MCWDTRSDRSIGKCIQYMNSAVIRSGNDVLPIGRVSNRPHRVSVPLKRVADWCTSLGIPDSNGAIFGSGSDVLPIRRVSNGPHLISVFLKRIADWSTSLGIPDSNGAVVGSGDDVMPIGRVRHGRDHV